MNLKNGLYVHSKYVNKCVKEDNKFYVIHNDKLLSVNEMEIDRKIFCQIPGFRLTQSIKDEGNYSVTTNVLSETNTMETIYFETEENVSYLINLDRIVDITNINSDIWLIKLEDEDLWFKSFPANFKHVLNQLRN